MKDVLQRLTEKKKKLDELRPLPPALIKNLDEWYAVELTYTSNALEGNTLTRIETAIVVEKGQTVAGKTLREHLEATNHAHAVGLVRTFAAEKKRQEFVMDDLLAIHRSILAKIDDAYAGVLRDVAVRVLGSQTVFPNHAKLAILMSEFVSWLQETDGHPVIVAADAHFKLVGIHPFVDGNGRTARLLMNLLLLQEGYPPAVIQMEDRACYIKSIETARHQNDFSGFYVLITQAVEKSLDMYLDMAGKSL